MKAIEPGCKAIFIYSKSHPELVGTVCDVVRPGTSMFAILVTESPWYVSTCLGKGIADERQLMRIDGYKQKDKNNVLEVSA